MAELGPYSQAVKDGKCPLCLGTGLIRPGTICVHDGPLHGPGEPCDLCAGTGAWPPPDLPPPTDLAGMRGFHSR